MDEKNWMPISPVREAFLQVRETVMKACKGRKDVKRGILVCDEIFQNIVEYSGAGHIWFYCGNRGAELEIGFMDDGKMFDATCAMLREKEFEDLKNGGMGLTVIRTLAHDLRYERVDGCNVLFVSVKTEEGFSDSFLQKQSQEGGMNERIEGQSAEFSRGICEIG